MRRREFRRGGEVDCVDVSGWLTLAAKDTATTLLRRKCPGRFRPQSKQAQGVRLHGGARIGQFVQDIHVMSTRNRRRRHHTVDPARGDERGLAMELLALVATDNSHKVTFGLGKINGAQSSR